MTVRRNLFALIACLALLGAAGCGGGDNVPLAVETDEPLYVQGQQHKRLGRHQEALVSFLKVIEKRGEQSAPESHFEVGLICHLQLKDQVEAIHHFQAYLNQKPNSTQAAGVRDLINTAKREYLKTLLGRSPEEYAVKAEGAADVEALRRENDELRAQLATLRGGGAVPVNRNAGRGFLALDRATPAPVGARTNPLDDAPVPSVAPARNATTSRPSPITTPAPTSTRAPAPTANSAAAGRRHKVAQGETLFSIAKKFDAVNTSKKMRDIVAANPSAFPGGNINALALGAELVIP